MPGLEPISPELALVSPELAAEARRALPDRPWEAFAPPCPPAPAPAERPALRLAPVPVAAPVDLPSAERARRRVVTPSRLVTAAVVGLLVATSLLPPRHGPRLIASEPVPVARAAATPPRFSIVTTDEQDCAAGRRGQRDPFRPVCPPPGRSR